MNNESLLKRLEPPEGRVRMVLDTDTYNEVDDQFALVYSLASTEKLNVEAVYAAPFLNDRSTSPGEGMLKSHEEIIKLLGKMNISPKGFVFKGSDRFMEGPDRPVDSEAVKDLVKRAMEGDAEDPLYVVAIGAITNIASAILIEPSIIDRIVVVWLGGHPLYWPDTREFNLEQDKSASRVILDSGVPLVQIPCMGVASHLLTTVPELEKYLSGRNPVCDSLVDLYKEYRTDFAGSAKEIWDISAVAWLVNSEWVPSALVHSPVLSDLCTWQADEKRHMMRTATFINRTEVFRDLFTKLSAL